MPVFTTWVTPYKSAITCIGVLFGYGSRRELEEAGADGIAATVPELTEILLGE